MDNKADNESQSQIKRLTTHNSPKLLTRQLGSVVRQKSDNQNQQITIAAFYKEEGIQEGIREGIQKERRKTVSSLIAFGMSPEEVAKALSLPLEEVITITKSK